MQHIEQTDSGHKWMHTCEKYHANSCRDLHVRYTHKYLQVDASLAHTYHQHNVKETPAACRRIPTPPSFLQLPLFANAGHLKLMMCL